MGAPSLAIDVKSGKCLVELNGRYFGYDNHPQYPEAHFDDPEDAYVFSSVEEALEHVHATMKFKDERYNYRIIYPNEAKKYEDKAEGETIYAITSGKNTLRVYKNKESRDKKLEWYHQNKPYVYVYPGEMTLES